MVIWPRHHKNETKATKLEQQHNIYIRIVLFALNSFLQRRLSRSIIVLVSSKQYLFCMPDYVLAGSKERICEYENILQIFVAASIVPFRRLIKCFGQIRRQRCLSRYLGALYYWKYTGIRMDYSYSLEQLKMTSICHYNGLIP